MPVEERGRRVGAKYNIAKSFAAQFANSVKFARINSCPTLWALHFAVNFVFFKLLTQKVASLDSYEILL